MIQVMNVDITKCNSLIATKNNRDCTLNKTTGGGRSVTFLVKGCNMMNPVKVTLMEQGQDTLGISVIFGGRGVAGYELQCTRVPIGKSITVLQAKLQAGESGYEYKDEHQASLDLRIEIKGYDTARTALSPVKVGIPFNLTISGSDQFRFHTMSCLAEDSKGKVQILIQDDGTTVVDLALLSGFTALVPAGSVCMETVAQLFAFDFVGSEEITLNCTVFACRFLDTTCQAPAHEIHKRAVDKGSSDRTESVEAGIRLVDEYYYPTSSGRTLRLNIDSAMFENNAAVGLCRPVTDSTLDCR